MDFSSLKINFLGDSITEGYGCTDNYGYVDYFHEYTGAVCRNYGIGGTRIARQKAKSENPKNDLDFCLRVKDMEEDADFVFIFGGTNDYGHGDAPFGEFSDRTPDTFFGALHTLYRSIIERFPKSEIIVVTPLHRAEEHAKANPTTGLHLKSYVQAIRDVAEAYSLPILDLYKSGGLQPDIPEIRERFIKDGLHPGDAYHKKLARKMISFIETNY